MIVTMMKIIFAYQMLLIVFVRLSSLGVDLALKGEHFRRASENKALGSSGRKRKSRESPLTADERPKGRCSHYLHLNYNRSLSRSRLILLAVK